MGNDRIRQLTGTIARWLLASILFVLIMLGWLGDCLLSLAMRRPMLTFHEVYASWKHHVQFARLSAGK
jgi:hypothetical protein